MFVDAGLPRPPRNSSSTTKSIATWACRHGLESSKVGANCDGEQHLTSHNTLDVPGEPRAAAARFGMSSTIIKEDYGDDIIEARTALLSPGLAPAPHPSSSLQHRRSTVTSACVCSSGVPASPVDQDGRDVVSGSPDDVVQAVADHHRMAGVDAAGVRAPAALHR